MIILSVSLLVLATCIGWVAIELRDLAVEIRKFNTLDLIGEIKSLREELRTADMLLAQSTKGMQKLLRGWDSDGLPNTRQIDC